MLLQSSTRVHPEADHPELNTESANEFGKRLPESKPHELIACLGAFHWAGQQYHMYAGAAKPLQSADVGPELV